MLHKISLDKLSKIISLNTNNKLNSIGIYNLQDLLLYLPTKYENHTKFSLIKDVKLGMIVNIKGIITKKNIFTNSKKNILTCFLNDKSGTIILRFFYCTYSIQKSLEIGKEVVVYGKIRSGLFGNEIINPKYWSINSFNKYKLNYKNLTPIYPIIKGISQTKLRNIICKVLKIIDYIPITELLPKKVSNSFMNIKDALKVIHKPPLKTSLHDLSVYNHPAQQRLILEEILAYYLSMLKIKNIIKEKQSYPMLHKGDIFKKFLGNLPFSLTSVQTKITKEIIRDLSLNVPMTRLLQGDVGSGKTILAALAAIYTVNNGYQVALMVPTELLAEQHFYNLYKWFSPLNITMCWLSSKHKSKIHQTKRKNISNGQISIVIGTQAIFQDDIHFLNLALIIIDEQHRFGVNQRFSFFKKGIKKNFYPHQLVISATPIPRTLSMISYANFDHSIINEIPDNREKVNTILVSNIRRKEIIDRVYKFCLNSKKQVYWVCTAVEDSNLSTIKSVKKTYKELTKIFLNISIGLIYGNMRIKDKWKVIEDFKLGKIQILVTSTIIEVGIDISNANLMVIENSERLGLTQLHQLRGRIGRGLSNSYCVLLYKSPLSRIAKIRLNILRNSSNGFFIAQKDLEIRGPGDFFGTRQTGNFKFKVANLVRDQKYFLKAKRLANHININYPKLANNIINRWIKIEDLCEFII